MKTGAVIVAAGLSSRMGSFKPLLPINGKAALQREVECFLSHGVQPIIVVCGHRADEVRSALEPYGAQVRPVFNPDYRGDMFLSVRLGAAALPEDLDAFFFLPADCPAVSGETLETLLSAFETADDTICIPNHAGRRGHPPLLPSGLVQPLLEYEGPGGLKGFMSQYSILEVSVEDPEIRRDMDTPEEYEKLLSVFGK